MVFGLSLWSTVAFFALLLPQFVAELGKIKKGETERDEEPFLGWLEGFCLLGTAILMCFDIGPFSFGFVSADIAVVWLFTGAVLASVNVGLWGIYFIANGRTFSKGQRIGVTVLPAAMYLITGAMCLNAGLFLFAAGYAFLSCRRMFLKLRREREEEKKKAAARTKKRKKA